MRDLVLKFRISQDEHDVIARAASGCGLTVSSYARLALMIEAQAASLARRHIVDRAAVAAINALGSNLNQIARVGNITKTLTPDQVHALSVIYSKLAKLVLRIETNAQGKA